MVFPIISPNGSILYGGIDVTRRIERLLAIFNGEN
jgi:hypothetical protein